MEKPLKIEVKRESMDIEENEILPSGYYSAGVNLDTVYTDLGPAVFADIRNRFLKDEPNLGTIKISKKSQLTLKESNKPYDSQLMNNFKLSEEERLREKEDALKIKESIIAMREASIKLKEDILKTREANLKLREEKLLKTESKMKSKLKVSKEKEECSETCVKDGGEKPVPITKSMQQCNICNKSLKYRTWLTHMREVHSPTTYVCYCKRFFHARRAYERHIQHVHNGLSRYSQISKPKTPNKCTKCDVEFDHPYRLKTHMRNVHSGEGKVIRCELCDSKFKSQGYLHSHMQRVHYDDGKVHACKICGKEFNSPRQVVIHIRNSHIKHGLEVESPKKQVRSEEKEDWSIETRSKYAMMCEQECTKDWEIQNENVDLNNTESTHRVKIELDDDIKGFSLIEVMLSPQQSCRVELRELNLENM